MVALCGRGRNLLAHDHHAFQVALYIFDNDDSVVDHQAVASVIPNSVSELMEKPKSLMNAKVPISETGMVMAE